MEQKNIIFFYDEEKKEASHDIIRVEDLESIREKKIFFFVYRIFHEENDFLKLKEYFKIQMSNSNLNYETIKIFEYMYNFFEEKTSVFFYYDTEQKRAVHKFGSYELYEYFRKNNILFYYLGTQTNKEDITKFLENFEKIKDDKYYKDSTLKNVGDYIIEYYK